MSLLSFVSLLSECLLYGDIVVDEWFMLLIVILFHSARILTAPGCYRLYIVANSFAQHWLKNVILGYFGIVGFV